MEKKIKEIPEKVVELPENPAPGHEKVFATQIELGTGCHMLGKSLTMSTAQGAILELTQYGIAATSPSGRLVLIPWPNVRCVELKKAQARKPGSILNRLIPSRNGR